MIDFKFKPNLENRRTGNVCPTVKQFNLMKKLASEGKEWSVVLMHISNLFAHARFPGTQEMLDTAVAVKNNKGKIRYYRMNYVPTVRV